MLRFQEFLEKTEYPASVMWVEPKDVLLTAKRLIYVRVTDPDTNEQNVRKLFEQSRISHNGILFEALNAANNGTYIFAWAPKDRDEAQGRLMQNGLKLSARTGENGMEWQYVSSGLRWALLRWALKGKQDSKSLLFS